MRADSYRIIIKLLRDIPAETQNIADNFQLDYSVFNQLLRKLELAEEVITTEFVYEDTADGMD